MRGMRTITGAAATVLLVAAMVPSVLLAQPFEGAVTMRIAGRGP